MAGVLFIIWIPCEGYEWNANKQPQQIQLSSDDEEIMNENSKARYLKIAQNYAYYFYVVY